MNSNRRRSSLGFVRHSSLLLVGGNIALGVIALASLRDHGMRYGMRAASRASIQIATAQTATTMATVKTAIAASNGASESTLPSGVDRQS
jgi:hypothetical protein